MSVDTVSRVENFKYFALYYLDVWCESDKDLIDLSRRKSRDDRLRGIQEAAKYYAVARNFKTLPGEKRLESALTVLDAISDSITDENVDSIVCKVAEEFRLAYGKTAISAASKFLWIRYQNPVVIYDSRAIECLNKECGGKLGQSDYATYRKEWLKHFTKREDSIRAACVELVQVKSFSLANDMTDVELRSVVAERWFAERVFDMFLWLNAGKKAVQSVEVQTLP